MPDSTASSTETGRRSARNPSHSHFFRRSFRCGHPDEYIEVRREEDGDQAHNLITLEVFQQHIQSPKSRPAYTLSRCLDCALKAKEEDDLDPQVWPKRRLSAYMSVAPPTWGGRLKLSRRNGFDGVLERYRYDDDVMEGAVSHPRVSEEGHQAFRRRAQAEARSGGKMVAIPPRRIYNASVQETSRVWLHVHQRDVSCTSGDVDNDLSQSQIGGRRVNSCYSERDTAISDKSLSGLGGETSTNGSRNTMEDEVKRMQDLIATKTEIQHVNFGRRASTRDSESNHESPQMSSCNARHLAHEPTASDGDSLLPACVTSMLSDERALHPQSANSSMSYERVSAFVEHLIDEYASSFDDTTDPPLLDLHKYSDPRPAPAPPARKRLSNFIQQRANTSPRILAKLASISKNFRKLRLDLDKSAKAVTKTEPDTDSPDWACRTSLAIEAGKISMYSVSRQDRESASSKHMTQTLRSPTRAKPALRHLDHDARSGRRRNTCPSPARRPSESNSIPSVRDRHSEGAPRAVGRARAAHLSGRLAGMETTLKEKASMRREANPPMDLNKSLPALPALRDRRTKGEDSSWI
ncbi:hypothetical protein EJ07DRAFT_155454 [Lizonia empirigonia]|nr:hypothetical protein EJ07DRAFT_155454 [Lizonia empirigonia]